jgi:hypothetical protein
MKKEGKIISIFPKIEHSKIDENSKIAKNKFLVFVFLFIIVLLISGFVSAANPCIHNPDCNDRNACTVDRCLNASCVYTALCAKGKSCKNGICYTKKTNATNICIGRNCNDRNACTIDSCNPSDGSCVHTSMTCAKGRSCNNGVCVKVNSSISKTSLMSGKVIDDGTNSEENNNANPWKITGFVSAASDFFSFKWLYDVTGTNCPGGVCPANGAYGGCPSKTDMAGAMGQAAGDLSQISKSAHCGLGGPGDTLKKVADSLKKTSDYSRAVWFKWSRHFWRSSRLS